ncbi:MAG TPA: EAL domain-containing protein [Clostridiales bacterium]|nr:EAL domain-containing protein [Clostridiales bacterium]
MGTYKRGRPPAEANRRAGRRREVRITNDLKNGIKGLFQNHEFYLCYQPILEVKSNKITAVEALVRWKHPELGMINPEEFISIAEKSLLIAPLGEWIMEEACRQMAAFHQGGWKVAVSVNISAVQLQQKDFSVRISHILKRYHLEPEFLVLEMTENALMEYNEIVDNNLRSLTMLGITMAIDDFGTGYNSFICLQNGLFDNIKIDKNFILHMSFSANRAIIASMIHLGHELNMKITAEGVEKEEHYNYLKGQGCDYIQGYYIGKPLPAEELWEDRKAGRIENRDCFAEEAIGNRYHR